jgi:hypothetical protein
MHYSPISAALKANELKLDGVQIRQLERDVKFLSGKLISKKSTVPAFCALALIECGGKLELRGVGGVYQENMFARIATDIDAPTGFRVGVNAKALADALKSCAHYENYLTIKERDHGGPLLNIRSYRTAFNLATVDDGGLPDAYGVETVESAFTLSGELIGDIDRLMPFTKSLKDCGDDDLKGIQVVRCELAGRDSVAAIACNGNQSAIARYDAAQDMPERIFMASELVALIKAAAAIEGQHPLSVEIGSEKMAVQIGRMRFTRALAPEGRKLTADTFADQLTPAAPDMLAPLASDMPRDFAAAAMKAGADTWEKCHSGLFLYVATYSARPNWMAISMPLREARPADETDCIVESGGASYNVPTKNGKIELTKAQVAELCGGASTFDVVEFIGRDGEPAYVTKWLWEDASLTKFRTVPKNGKIFGGEVRDHYTRAEIEAALAGDTPVTDTAPPAPPLEEIESQSAPVAFASIQSFRDALQIGTQWEKQMMEIGQWVTCPYFRTVAKVQQRDIVFARNSTPITPELLAKVQENLGAQGSWLGFPARDKWLCEGDRFVILDRHGNPFMRLRQVAAPIASPAIEAATIYDAPIGPELPAIERAAMVSEIRGCIQYGSSIDNWFVVGLGHRFESCEGPRGRWYVQRENRVAAYGEGYATKGEAIEAARAAAADYSAELRADKLPAQASVSAEPAPAPECEAETLNVALSARVAEIEARLAAIETDAPLSGKSDPYLGECDEAAKQSACAQWKTAYRMARTKKSMEGAQLAAAFEEMAGRFMAMLFYVAVTNIRRPAKGIRPALQRAILNGGGTKSPWLAPAMGTERFEAWRRIATRNQSLANHLTACGMTTGNAGINTLALVNAPLLPPAPVSNKGAFDDRPRRLRIVRAYLAMRKQRRELFKRAVLAEFANKNLREDLERAQFELRTANSNNARGVEQLAIVTAERDEAREMFQTELRRAKDWYDEAMKLRRRRARILPAAIKHRAAARTATLDLASARNLLAIRTAALVKLESAMADPMMPERQSDIARLVQERDAARDERDQALAKAARIEMAADSLGDQIDAMAARMVRAEQALKRAGITPMAAVA